MKFAKTESGGQEFQPIGELRMRDTKPAVTAADIEKLIQQAQQEPGYSDFVALMNLVNEVSEFQVEHHSTLVPTTVVSSATGTLAA
ncbi:MAG TPA: hypothetical protein VHA15_01600 [Burkholderiales bacterium]|nr:hypothetical protein [Burkholderiales bacterium]